MQLSNEGAASVLHSTFTILSFLEGVSPASMKRNVLFSFRGLYSGSVNMNQQTLDAFAFRNIGGQLLLSDPRPGAESDSKRPETPPTQQGPPENANPFFVAMDPNHNNLVGLTAVKTFTSWRTEKRRGPKPFCMSRMWDGLIKRYLFIEKPVADCSKRVLFEYKTPRF
ncbi:hypothetical protein P9112_004063 [Eukaryota sp. TZLM1-RC]